VVFGAPDLIRMVEALLPALSIFFMRVADISLYTIRLMMLIHGRKKLAWLFAFFQSLIYITVLQAIINDMGNVWKIAGYATGFATGLVVGMMIEGRLGLGNMHLNIVSSGHGQLLAEQLRAAGFGVTEFPGKGKNGAVDVLLCDVRRRHVPVVRQIIQNIDPEAFITAEMLRTVLGGYWRR
jgi:uncharacterized protein YebE (UPF0316 family)